MRQLGFGGLSASFPKQLRQMEIPPARLGETGRENDVCFGRATDAGVDLKHHHRLNDGIQAR
jgi:hypothetical protein